MEQNRNGLDAEEMERAASIKFVKKYYKRNIK